ncbi:MAG TPA: hypothetical protein VFN55_16265 [Solirubrobacteraceae bacterium]|nr:hypothetical protein [Solirubrobacteraceae bacterium]
MLPSAGVYRVAFNVTIQEPGQLALTLDGVELADTATGRAAGSSAISGEAPVRTLSANSLLTVRNPPGEPNALTVAPVAGCVQPNAATLIIEQLS